MKFKTGIKSCQDITIESMSGTIIPNDSVKQSIECLDSTLYTNTVSADIVGFPDITEVTISLTGINKDTLVISPVDTTFRYYSGGKMYIVTGSRSVKLPDINGVEHANGMYYIYFNDGTGTLKISQTPWEVNNVNVPVAIVYWYQPNPVGQRSLIGYELHTTSMSASTHKNLHLTQGTKRISGGDLYGYTLKTATNGDICYGITESVIADEDIYHTLPELVDGNGSVPNYTIFHYDSLGVLGFKQGQVTPFFYTTNGYIQKNSATGLIQCTNNRYINTYVFFTNFQGEARYVIIPSCNEYTSSNDAFNESVNDIGITNFPFSEFVCMYQITWYTNSNYSNVGKCRIERVTNLELSPNEIKNDVIQIVATSVAPTLGFILGSRLTYVNTTTVKVDAGILEIGGLSYQSSSDVTVSWVNTEGGIVRQANTWYYVYAEPDADNPSSWTPFISTVLPTKNQFGQTVLSSGNYPKYHPTRNARFIGSFKTNSSNQIMEFLIISSYVAYIGQGYNYIIQNGTSRNKTAVNCRDLVPYTSSLAQVYYELGSGNNLRYVGDTDSWYLKAIGGSGGLLIPVTNNSIYYQCDRNSISLGIHGYHEII